MARQDAAGPPLSSVVSELPVLAAAMIAVLSAAEVETRWPLPEACDECELWLVVATLALLVR